MSIEHHSSCFQVRPEGPHPDLPELCDCATIRLLEEKGYPVPKPGDPGYPSDPNERQ